MKKRSLNILEEITIIKNNDVEKGLFWKSDVPHLPANRIMTILLYLLEREFCQNLDFVKLYQDQVEEYITLGHTHQLSKE